MEEEKVRLQAIILKAKDKYFKENKAATNCINEATYKNKAKIADDCKKIYKDLLTNFNNSIEANRAKYKNSLDIWSKNEEAKISQVKNSLSSFEAFVKIGRAHV